MRINLLNVLFAGIFAAACVYGQTQPTVTSSETATSRGTCAAFPASQSGFLTSDAQVWFDFLYTGGSAGDAYSVQWSEPTSGIIYTTFSFTQAQTGGHYCYQYQHLHRRLWPGDSSGNVDRDSAVERHPRSTRSCLLIAAAQLPPPQIPGGGGASEITPAGRHRRDPRIHKPCQPPAELRAYSWSVLGGGLPGGLALSHAGTLAGIPTRAGSSVFTAQVTDATGASASSMFLVTIAPQGLTFTTASPLPNAIVGSDYPPQIFAAKGGTAPYTFQTSSALPGGLTFAGGEISGIPTTAGAFTLTVTATDSSSPPLTASAPFLLTVQPAHSDLILSQTSLAFALKVGATGLPSGSEIAVRSSVALQLLNYSVTVTARRYRGIDVSGAAELTPGGIRIGLDPAALSLAA